MYSILLENKLSKFVVKGVGKVVAKQQLTHEMFKHCLMENFEMTHKMVKIGHTQQLEIQTSMKKSLCPFNDKKRIEKYGEEFKTYSFGLKKLKGQLYLNFLKIFSFVFRNES